MFWNKKNPDLNKLALGTGLETQKEKWTVTEISNYDWGVDGRSVEYLLTSGGGREAYLEVERFEGENEIYFSEAVSIKRNILEEAIKNTNLIYKDTNFELDEHYNGSFKNETLMTSWRPLESYLFYDFNDMIITIEVIEKTKFQAYYGKEITENDIKF
jgi:hypothetical protein